MSAGRMLASIPSQDCGQPAVTYFWSGSNCNISIFFIEMTPFEILCHILIKGGNAKEG